MQPSGSGTSAGGTPSPSSGTFLRLFGIPVRLHFTFVLLLIFLIVLGVGGAQSHAASALYLLSLFVSVLLHELGHALVARRFGIRTLEIVMFPIGGLARLGRDPVPREELWIALAGPLVNVVLGSLVVGVAILLHHRLEVGDLQNPTDLTLLARIAAGNFMLALFNLLPAFPMDGGRVLRAFLARSRPEVEATRIATTAGRMLAIGMGLYGLLSAQFMLVFIAFFVYLGAAQEGMQAMGRSLTEGIPVKTAMVTDFRTLAHGDTVGDAARLLLATSQQDFPVMHGDQVLGLLGRAGLLRAMAREGPQAYVAGVMDREFVSLEPDMNLAAALPLMAGAGSCALVMQGGQLLGLLTAENLSEFLLLRRVGMPATLAGYDGGMRDH